MDNLHGDELIRFVRQRKGIIHKAATYATCQTVKVTGGGTVRAGDLFESDGGVFFKALATTAISGEGITGVRCTIAGTAGNVGAGSITKMPVTIPGIVSCVNEAAATGGYEEESEDSLRERYYEALRQPATSGNIYHYKQWAKEVAGCGDAKAFPLWQGDNTVQVVIINDTKAPADSDLVAKVQEHIDPGCQGTGEGQAPIGAYCTVTSAEGLTLTVSTDLMLLDGYDLETAREYIRDNITAYLREIAFKQNYVSYGKVSEAILNAEGVEDYANMLLNGGVANIPVPEKSVAVLGEVTVSEQG